MKAFCFKKNLESFEKECCWPVLRVLASMSQKMVLEAVD
jgi:hypothetical protein